MTDGPVSPYRDPALVKRLADALARTMDGLPPARVMHVCGTHEHEIGRNALRQLLPGNLEVIAGPGCPVCITPASAIATAAALAKAAPSRILCAYGDVLRVPTEKGCLLDAKREGGDVRLVYGPPDALRLAAENPSRQVVFFSVGFETTAAPVAALLQGGVPPNFLVYPCHRYVPEAVRAIVAGDPGALDGFLLPGHASVITGTVAYQFLVGDFGRCAAVAGFEPADILAGILAIARQLREKRPAVENCYPRAVRDQGNPKAQAALADVFDLTDARWRGIGTLPATGFELKGCYRRLDALEQLQFAEVEAEDVMPGCSCHLIMLGRRTPAECPLFKTKCTPAQPQGPCMVGMEGTCNAWYRHGAGV